MQSPGFLARSWNYLFEVLRSPKEHIDIPLVGPWERWQRVISAVANEEELDPIEVIEGNGVPIDEVGFVS